jgi:hypothetical protein
VLLDYFLGWARLIPLGLKKPFGLLFIAGDQPELRDHVFEQGDIKPLLHLILHDTKVNLIDFFIE